MMRRLTQRPDRSQRKRIVAALARGPGTSMDVSRYTGLPLRYCSAVLGVLWRERRIQRSTDRVRPANGMGSGAFTYSVVPKRPWRRSDELRLTEMLQAKMDPDEIATQLGRTRGAVLNRAFRLGLSVSKA